MKIIGVFGGSGSGKTTVVRMLQDKINNSVAFSADVSMIEHSKAHKDEILEMLGATGGGDFILVHQCDTEYR